MKFMLIKKIDFQKEKNESPNHAFTLISFVEYKSKFENKKIISLTKIWK
jgi:hypothetical protein